MEHLQHFGLKQDPFSNEPDLRFYFESASHRDAQRRVERGLRQHKGLTLLTGDGGMGKTLLARRILDGLEEEVFEATLLVMLPGAADATGILQRFARQLGCDAPAADRAGLLGQIYEQLAIVREDGRHAVLIIDDAQIMRPEVFAELAGLLNLEYEDRRLLSMLFVGSSELDELVQNDSSIAPRIDVRVRLQPLDTENTQAYLNHRLKSVAADPALIPTPAVEVLYKLGRGRPRLLNTLADNALFEAYLAGRRALDPADIERAAADLGIGPDPGATYAPLASPASPPLHSDSAVAPAPAAPPSPASPDFLADSDPFAGSTDLLDEVPPALDLDEPVPTLDLVPEPPAALDLDAGFEAALDDFSSAAPTSAPAFSREAPAPPTLAATPEAVVGAAPVHCDAAGEPLGALEFEMEPLPGEPPPLEELSFAVATEAAEAPLIELEEAQLASVDGAELEELEDAFVELIED